VTKSIKQFLGLLLASISFGSFACVASFILALIDEFGFGSLAKVYNDDSELRVVFFIFMIGGILGAIFSLPLFLWSSSLGNDHQSASAIGFLLGLVVVLLGYFWLAPFALFSWRGLNFLILPLAGFFAGLVLEDG
jgi:hypothetical protein